MGGNGGIVEADETYLWQSEKAGPATSTCRRPPRAARSAPAGKRAIVSLVERGGSVRSFHVENADKATVNVIVGENVAREAVLHTDESRIYNDALQARRRARDRHATRLASTSAATSTPTRSRASSRSSSAG